MSLLAHVFIAIGYAVFAIGGAIGLAADLPGIGLAPAAALGASAALAGALVHLGWLHWQSETGLRRQVDALRADHDKVARELERAREEARQIFTALERAGHGGGGLKEVVAEVRVLQRLVGQLWSRDNTPGEGMAADGVAGGTPAAATGAGPGRGVTSGRIATRPGVPAEAAEIPAAAAGPAPSPDEHAILDMVRRSLSAGRVELFLQPVVGLPQRRRRFYECFSRLRAEDGSFVNPEAYLPLVARENLLPAIDNMLLFRCIQLIRKARSRAAGVGFFCNISRRSLLDRDFIGDFIDFLRQNDDLAASLIFEVAQPEADLADPLMVEHLDRLARAGIRFSLDNVEDLAIDPALLAQRNFGFVKVAASLFEGADTEGPWEGSLFQLRRRLADHGIVLVLEKIESERQLVELLEFNIELGQGYLFGEPRLSADAA